MPWRACLIRGLLAASLIVAANARAAAQTAVDVLLVLAVDASGSVNQARFELQKQGYAAAFRHARVLRAIHSGARRQIAAMMMQWTGPALQVQAVPWTLLRDEGSVNGFADAIEKAPRDLFSGGTSISGAIDHGMRLLSSAPYQGTKRVIDVSGDGSNNRGVHERKRGR
jgi:hypothetical protein